MMSTRCEQLAILSQLAGIVTVLDGCAIVRNEGILTCQVPAQFLLGQGEPFS